MVKKGIILFLIWIILPHIIEVKAEEKKLSIVYNEGLAPIKFTDKEGNPSGILNEYWKFFAEAGGYTVDFRSVATFSESLEMVKSGEADLHAGLFFTSERDEFLEYTDPTFSLNYYIYSSEDLSPLESLEHAGGLLIGIVQGGYTENLVRKIIPKERIVKYSDYDSLFTSVIQGELKAFVSSDIHLNYYLSSNDFDYTFNHSDTILYSQTYYGATSENNNKLIPQIKKIQSELSESRLHELKNRWFTFKRYNSKGNLLAKLSQEQRLWLTENPVLRVSNEMDWPPFDFNQKGIPMGLSIDLLEIISNRLGLTLQYVYGYSWNELQEMIKNKNLDVIHSLNRSRYREEYILFSGPYISNQTVLVTSDDDMVITAVEDLHNKKVAVIDGYNQKRILQKRYPSIQLISVDSPLAALKAVSSGHADATIRFNGVASYLIRNHMLTNLKFVNEFDLDNDNLNDLFLGVRSDLPILQEILDLALQSITVEEMNQLKGKWFLRENNPLQKPIVFTKEERNWLDNTSEVTLGADFNWPPFDFIDDEGKHAGIAAEYVKIIRDRSGLSIRIHSDVWANILPMMENDQLDGLICAVSTRDREKYLNFTKPYLSVPTAIITRKENETIYSPANLKGKIVSVNRGSYMHDWMKNRFPLVKLHLSSSNQESLEAVSYGTADAYVGNLAVADYIIRKKLLTNLKIVRKLDDMVTDTAIAIEKDNTILFSIISKVLDSVTEKEKKQILDKWYETSTEKKVHLTNKERQWLNENPEISISGDPAWAPLSFINSKGKYSGIIPDFLKLIEQRSGITFSIHQADSWSTVLELFRDNTINLIDGITRSRERKKLMNFSDVYISADIAFITRDDINFIKNFHDVSHKRVATVKNYITQTYIEENHPSLQLRLHENAKEGLVALSNGETDVFIIDIPTFEYYAREGGLSNLRISGLTPYSFDLSIGVQKEDSELLSIINKAIALIDEKEKSTIYSNWVTLSEPLIDYSAFAKVFIVVLFAFSIFGYWNRRLATEVNLRKKAEMQALQASRAKSEFLANMSHEIRTPMNSVLGFAELLDNMITDKEQKNYLKSIRSGGKALLNIINDILDLSKIEAGKMHLQPEPMSLGHVFDEMNDLFNTRFSQKDIAFTVHLDPVFPAYIITDGVRLRQILINLLGNSLKFTEAGEVELTGSVDRLVEEDNEIHFSINVRDTGIGISPENQETIFNKFEQTGGQNHNNFGGTGLGLSICKNLLAMMDGEIKVDSELGKGSEFILKFEHVSLGDKPEVEDKFTRFNKFGFTGGTVVIADDIKDNRALFCGFFNDSSIHFLEAENGQDVLDLVESNSIDLIFLDLRMPVLNGYETISILKQNRSSENIPVVAFTASVMGDDLEKVKQYGFDGYLRKPAGQQDIYEMMAKFLPYEHPTDSPIDEIDHEVSSLPNEKVMSFVTVIQKGLMPMWLDVKDKGDFELIRIFADKLRIESDKHRIDSFSNYAEELVSYIDSFDILEVDILMKKFPELVKKIEHGN